MNWLATEFDGDVSDRSLIVAPTIENAHNLAPGYIANLRKSYSKRLQKAVIDGFFTILEGSVYEAIDPDIWNSPWVVDHEYNPALQTHLAIDPGYRRSAWIFIQEVRKHEWVVFDELILDACSDMRAVEMVNAKGYRIDEIWTDPASRNTQSAFDVDTISMLRGIKSRTVSPIRYISGFATDIAYGVDKMRVLYGDPEYDLPIRIKFARRLKAIEMGKDRGIVKDTLAYRYPDRFDSNPDKPVKDGLTDHTNDALRYWGVGTYMRSGVAAVDAELQKMRSRSKSGGYRSA